MGDPFEGGLVCDEDHVQPRLALLEERQLGAYLVAEHVDTAFMPISDLRRLIVAGLGSRVLFGSDVPIDRCYRRGEPRPRYRRRLAAVARTAGRWAQDV